jgi:hypothetical protein
MAHTLEEQQDVGEKHRKISDRRTLKILNGRRQEGMIKY